MYKVVIEDLDEGYVWEFEVDMFQREFLMVYLQDEINLQGTRVPTTDTPVATVGDSLPLNEHNLDNSGGHSAGHHGSSLECMHPFCVAERKKMAALDDTDKLE